MDVYRHWSGESLHAELLYDGDVADGWMAWHRMSEDWRLKWERIAVLLNSNRRAVGRLEQIERLLALALADKPSASSVPNEADWMTVMDALNLARGSSP